MDKRQLWLGLLIQMELLLVFSPSSQRSIPVNCARKAILFQRRKAQRIQKYSSDRPEDRACEQVPPDMARKEGAEVFERAGARGNAGALVPLVHNLERRTKRCAVRSPILSDPVKFIGELYTADFPASLTLICNGVSDSTPLQLRRLKLGEYVPRDLDKKSPKFNDKMRLTWAYENVVNEVYARQTTAVFQRCSGNSAAHSVRQPAGFAPAAQGISTSADHNKVFDEMTTSVASFVALVPYVSPRRRARVSCCTTPSPPDATPDAAPDVSSLRARVHAAAKLERFNDAMVARDELHAALRQLPAEDRVLEANEQFYDAMTAGDVDGMMARWAGDPTISVVTSFARVAVGPAAVANQWTRLFASRGKLSVDSQVRSVSVEDASAWVVVDQTVASPGNSAVSGPAVAMNVFRRVGEEWLLLHHHAAPVMVEPVRPGKEKENDL